MPLVSQSEFARMCGVSRQAVLKWKSAGMLVLQGKAVDIDATDEQMQRYHAGGSPLRKTVNQPVDMQLTNPAVVDKSEPNSLPLNRPPDDQPALDQQISGSARAFANPGTPDLDAAAEALQELVRPGESVEQAALRLSSQGPDEMSFDEARRLKEYWLMRLNELEYDQKSGLVVLVEDVGKAVGAQLAAVRTRLRSIGPNYGPQLSRLKTPEEASRFISDKIDEVLTELTVDSPNTRWDDPSHIQAQTPQ